MKRIVIAAAGLGLALTLVPSCSMDGYYMENGYYYSSLDGAAVNTGLMPSEENPDGGKFDEIRDNDFIATSEQPVSTFSVDADGACYTWLRRCIESSRLPVQGAVRIEEYINYFPFDYAGPTDGNTVALNAEVGACPWAPEHKLIRLGLQGKALKEDEIPTANFVFLIDVSGSMTGADRLDLLKSSLIAMTKVMSPNDRIAIVTYSGTVKKLLGSTPVSDAKTIVAAIKKLTASGSTAGGEAMKMAYEEALKNFIEGGNNRVIMGTDGDFNVGVTDTNALKEMVQNYAKKGIYLTICGFGMGNLNDSMMETLSNEGNGTYEYIANADDMEKVFIRERGKFCAVANDCKIQVSFNPATVAQYRLIGYENRRMSNDDFENDEKDAAEIGAGQSITALYEIIPAEGADPAGKVARFDFRYKKSLSEESIPMGIDVVPADAAPSESFSFAAALASYGMILRDSKYKGASNLTLVTELATAGSKTFDPYGYRAAFLKLVEKTSPLVNKTQ